MKMRKSYFVTIIRKTLKILLYHLNIFYSTTIITTVMQFIFLLFIIYGNIVFALFFKS